jgi:hypothetical protein
MSDEYTPTCELRWHKHVTGSTWTYQWVDTFFMVLEQKWVNEAIGEEWRPLPEHVTQEPNQKHLG